jgi:2-keto-3-deoxy-L-rhamnonate aldolase RhmA
MNLRRHLLNGATSYGPLLLSDSPIIAELVGSIGYGHVIIDHEHSPTNVASGQRMLQALRAGSSCVGLTAATATVPIVRLPSADDPVYMKKVLDSLQLPGGVLVPMVESASTARSVVQSIRYPNQRRGRADSITTMQAGGIRGCAAPFVRATGYGAISMEEYIQKCQEELLVMVQVESPLGVSAIADIANVDGIDGIFLGPLDLSASIGCMGDFDDARFIELLEDAENRILDSGKILAGFRTPGRELDQMFQRGYQLVCGSVDLGLLRDAYRKDAAAGNSAAASYQTNTD